MQESKESAGLLSLHPAELRNRVYELVLEDGDSINLFKRPWLRSSCCRQPPLARTCQHIRCETLSMYYSCSEFRYSGCEEEFRTIVDMLFAGMSIGAVSRAVRDTELLSDAGTWLRSIGRQNATHIQSLEIRINQDRWSHSLRDTELYCKDIAPYTTEISAVLSDYLRRENIPLPARTSFFAFEQPGPLSEAWDGTWKVLSLPLLKNSAIRGWDMVV